MQKTDMVESEYLRDDIPNFRPGDTVKVHVRVVEGSRERIQLFQGVLESFADSVQRGMLDDLINRNSVTLCIGNRCEETSDSHKDRSNKQIFFHFSPSFIISNVHFIPHPYDPVSSGV